MYFTTLENVTIFESILFTGFAAANHDDKRSYHRDLSVVCHGKLKPFIYALDNKEVDPCSLGVGVCVRSRSIPTHPYGPAMVLLLKR